MDPYSSQRKMSMSYRKPVPIYVPTPPSSPPQPVRESVRYSFAEAALNMNVAPSAPREWRFTTASVASQSTASFPSSEEDGESSYDLPFAADLSTRELKTSIHQQPTRRPSTSMKSLPPAKGRRPHQIYRPPTPPQAAQIKPLPASSVNHRKSIQSTLYPALPPSSNRKSVQSTLYPVLPPASKALPNIPISAESPPWDEFAPLSPTPKMVPLMISDVHREHIPLPPSQVMLPAVPPNARRSTSPSKTWNEGSTCTWDSTWQDLPTLKQYDASYTSFQRKFERPRSETSPSLLGRLRTKLETCISEIPLCR